ncbi:hypothetical protein OG948_57285 (plasmid) [Embleya sp. NBC_00888]|uniref:hypothetical protein n=1 Tax=Embleya sp. NBC_00888 TaxID=2975960 RepID=UPI002F919A9D|nr:hypothetical protein OG948_57285 [Embleya sp. NBC_00888]
MTATTAMAALWTLVAGVGAFVVVCLSLGIARWWVLRPGNAVVARAKRGEITLWQAACEAQGARGFVCAGARVLHRRGLVHISRDGLVTATDTSPDQAPDPYSARILDAVRRRAALGRVRLRDLAHDLDHRDVPRVAPELDVIERRAKAVTTTATRVTTAIVWACTITWAVLVVPDWAYLYAVLAVGVFLTMCAIRGGEFLVGRCGPRHPRKRLGAHCAAVLSRYLTPDEDQDVRDAVDRSWEHTDARTVTTETTRLHEDSVGIEACGGMDCAFG